MAFIAEINQSIQDAVAAVETIMSEGADAAMNRYNKKAEKKS